MEFSGTQTIDASIDKVWMFLLDVNKVASCAPGFQSLEELGEEHWKAIVGVGVGAVKAKFVVSGTIASVCARLLQGVAEKLTDQFFECLKTKLQAADAEVTAE